jgi:hypothetical protein
MVDRRPTPVEVVGEPSLDIRIESERAPQLPPRHLTRCVLGAVDLYGQDTILWFEERPVRRVGDPQPDADGGLGLHPGQAGVDVLGPLDDHGPARQHDGLPHRSLPAARQGRPEPAHRPDQADDQGEPRGRQCGGPDQPRSITMGSR